jgi:hypothetical protein
VRSLQFPRLPRTEVRTPQGRGDPAKGLAITGDAARSTFQEKIWHCGQLPDALD